MDGAYGDGVFTIDKTEERLENYLQINTKVKDGVIGGGFTFDPWNLKLTKSRITEYELLTDHRGEAFYRQAVAYMKDNALTETIDYVTDLFRDADTVKDSEASYENENKQNAEDLKQLEEQSAKQEEEKKQQEDSGSTEGGSSGEAMLPSAGSQNGPDPSVENPLKTIEKLRRSKLTALVTGGDPISEKTIKGEKLPSKSRLKKGTMKRTTESGEALDDILFREYLMDHFSNYRSDEKNGALSYEIEYLIAGKQTDSGNLDAIVKQLLTLRGAANYLYCIRNSVQESQAENLAMALVGFLGNPAITGVVKHALLLAWSFGEALVDVRSLLDGGKVPLLKHAGDWNLSLENLSKVAEYLKNGRPDQKKGSDYQDYLRILLKWGNLSRQKMRALDLIQTNIQKEDGSSKFKADQCITAFRSEASWECRPIFLRLSSAFMNLRSGTIELKQQGSISY